MSIELKSFLISFTLTSLIYLVPYEKLSRKSDFIGKQKFHYKPTPRIGGLVIFIAFWLVLFSEINYEKSHGLFLISLIIFGIGLLEDITFRIPPIVRISFIGVSVGLCFFYLNIGILKFDIVFLDNVFSNNRILMVLFSIIVISGVVNSFNIIDGFNGLAMGICILSMLSILALGILYSDLLVADLSKLLIYSILGLLVFNFPSGKIFLGDGGAYFIGFIATIIGLIATSRLDAVSNWFLLLTFIYPIYETVFSIYRKKFIRGKSPFSPDRSHMHMLIHLRIVKKIFKRKTLIFQNSFTGFLIVFAISPFMYLAFVWHDNKAFLAIVSIIFMGLYNLLYRYIVKFGKI